MKENLPRCPKSEEKKTKFYRKQQIVDTSHSQDPRQQDGRHLYSSRKTLKNNYRNQAPDQRFSLKTRVWYLSCRLRKTGSAQCYLRISTSTMLLRPATSWRSRDHSLIPTNNIQTTTLEPVYMEVGDPR